MNMWIKSIQNLISAACLVLVMLSPTSVFADDLYVERADDMTFMNHRIERYDGLTGGFIDTFINFPGTDFQSLGPLSFGPNGDLYFSVSSPTTVPVLNRYDGVTGQFISTVVTDDIQSYAFGPDQNLYVGRVDDVTQTNHRIERYDGLTGGFIDTFISSFGTEFQGLGSLAFGPDGDLYFGASGAIMGVPVLNRYDGVTGQFKSTVVTDDIQSQSYAFGPDQNLYVGRVDDITQTNHRIERYNGLTGGFIDTFISSFGTEFQGLGSLAFGPDGDLYFGASGAIMGVPVLNRYDGVTGQFKSTVVTDDLRSYAFGPEVPEPTTISILGVCVGVLGGLRRQRCAWSR